MTRKPKLKPRKRRDQPRTVSKRVGAGSTLILPGSGPAMLGLENMGSPPVLVPGVGAAAGVGSAQGVGASLMRATEGADTLSATGKLSGRGYVQRRIAVNPHAYRDEARAISAECKTAAERIKARLSNRNPKADRDQAATLDALSSGLSKLADAVDDDIEKPASDTSFRKAAQIAADLYAKAKAFLEQNPTIVVTATYCVALTFLHGVGIDDYAASLGLALLLKGRLAPQKAPNQEGPKQTKAKRNRDHATLGRRSRSSSSEDTKR